MKVTLTGKMATYKFKAHYPSYLVANYLKSFVYLGKNSLPFKYICRANTTISSDIESITLKL